MAQKNPSKVGRRGVVASAADFEPQARTTHEAQLQNRIAELEQRIAELEHIGLVEQSMRASAKSLAVGWDNPLDAEYDDL